MNEEVTKDLTADEKLDLILSRLTGLDTRLTGLEERVEDRLKDTRPMWQVIHAQTEKLVQQYGQFDERLGRIEDQNALLIEQNRQLVELYVRFDERLARIEDLNARLDERLARVEEQNILLAEQNKMLVEQNK